MCGDNMEHNRKQKLLMIIALMLSIASLSIGFAAFSVSLNVSSQASVSPNSDTFSVKFSTNKDSLVVDAVTPSSKTSGITTSDGVIDNSTNPTIKNLSATFTNPGQYVEYIFYTRNEGEYTAYLNNINFIGSKICKGEAGTTDSLVQSACESINITATIGDITYTETTPITGHTLNKKTGEEIKVRLEYASNGAYVDGAISITFPNVALVYSTLDDSTITPELSFYPTVISGDIDTIGSEICIAEECFFVISSTEETVTMLAKYNLYFDVSFDESNNFYYFNSAEVKQSEASTTMAFSRGQYWKNEEYVYPSDGYIYDENTFIYSVIENYKTYLTSLGVSPNMARLIAVEELESLGCSKSNRSCSGSPSWVYSTNYWTGTSNYWYIWIIDSNGTNTLVEINFNHGTTVGVRPVITISKTYF